MTTSHDWHDPGVRPAIRHAILWTLVAGLTVTLQWPWLVLYLDLRYTFGAFRTGGQLGLPPSELFIHRPMANRLLMAALDQLTSGSTVFRERLTLALAILFAALAGAGLARALRAWMALPVATWVGLATFTALAWAPSVAVLQPEWTAALLSVAAVSLVLDRRASRLYWSSPAIVIAGLLLAVATLQKYTTATTVVVALGLLFVLHRRRAGMVAAYTAVLSVVLFALTLVNGHERQWFFDMPQLNQTGSLHWSSLGRSLWNLAWLNPILMLWPAAIVLGFRLSRRRSWVLGCALALAILLAGVVVQNGYFPYHYAALPVLAAGLVALACGLWWQRTGRLSGIVIVGLVWIPAAAWLARRPPQWRTEHAECAITSVALVIVASVSLVLWQTRELPSREPRARTSSLASVLTVLTLALVISFPAWPHTPYAIFTARATRVSEVAGRARFMEVGREMREAAGAALTVYLARQDAPYFVDLPTSCVYPTATFLYRSAQIPEPGGVLSLQENLACLRDPATEYLVLQPSMIEPSRALGVVRDTVTTQFDCEHPTLRAGSFILCPRR